MSKLDHSQSPIHLSIYLYEKLTITSTTVNLGPLMGSMDASLKIPNNPRADGYGYNPRCLRRDVNSYFTTQFLRPIDIATHITSSKDIDTFQTTLQTDTTKAFSLHTAGHYTIWGDPGGDFYVGYGTINYARVLFNGGPQGIDVNFRLSGKPVLH